MSVGGPSDRRGYTALVHKDGRLVIRRFHAIDVAWLVVYLAVLVAVIAASVWLWRYADRSPTLVQQATSAARTLR